MQSSSCDICHPHLMWCLKCTNIVSQLHAVLLCLGLALFLVLQSLSSSSSLPVECRSPLLPSLVSQLTEKQEFSYNLLVGFLQFHGRLPADEVPGGWSSPPEAPLSWSLAPRHPLLSTLLNWMSPNISASSGRYHCIAAALILSSAPAALPPIHSSCIYLSHACMAAGNSALLGLPWDCMCWGSSVLLSDHA